MSIKYPLPGAGHCALKKLTPAHTAMEMLAVA
jgi:hypothetical protein